MTTKQYLAALKKLGLPHAGKATRAALGVSERQLQYYAAGRPIPETIAIILQLRLAAAASERARLSCQPRSQSDGAGAC